MTEVKRHVFHFNPDDCCGESFLLTTSIEPGGGEPFVTQEIQLNSYGSSASFHIPAFLTPENLRKLANELDSFFSKNGLPFGKEQREIRGKVAKILGPLEAPEVALNVGFAQGVKEGMVFNVFDYDPTVITDPETGEVLGSVATKKHRVKITKVEEKFSVASPLVAPISPPTLHKPHIEGMVEVGYTVVSHPEKKDGSDN